MNARRSTSHSLAWLPGRDSYSLSPTPGPADVKVDGLYEQAMRHQREGNLESALALYDQVIRTDPDYAEAFYGRAMVYYALGSCDQAINDCNTAIDLRHRFPEAFLVRGAAYWGKAALLDEADTQRSALCEQVVSDCTYVLDLQPRNGMAHFNRGLAYMALGNKPMAKYDIENAVALLHDPEWRAEAEAWLRELRKPSSIARYERPPLA